MTITDRRAAHSEPGRRAFLLAASALGAALPWGCAASAGAAYKPWSSAGRGHADPRLDALSYALLAPSSHNTQPWLVDLSTPRQIALYVDPARCLPYADPLRRQTIISHGAFLEQLDLGLRRRGKQAHVTYAGADGEAAAVAGERPLVTVELGESAASADPLLDAVARRRTNKRPYEKGRAVEPAKLTAIGRAAGRPGAEVHWVTERRKVAELASLCRSATAIDVASRARNEETAAWFRFDDDEIEAKADGFGLVQGGTTGLAKWFAEAFLLSRRAAADPRGLFARKAVELCWDQASTAAAFGVVWTPGNARGHQIEAGRAYVRAQLAAARAGVQSQPFSQLLQEYPEMKVLRAQLERHLALPPGGAIQMLFRVGYAEPTPPAPRRALRAIVRGGA